MTDIFLTSLAFIYLVFASISDLKKKEVPNWLNFSLIVFAFVYRVFYALAYNEFWFLAYGIIGLLIFIGLAYAFYYSRVFAGGDAKLLMGMGVILPLNAGLISNLLVFGAFILLVLFAGGIYGIGYSLFLAFGNKRKFVREFKKQFLLNKKIFFISLIFAILSVSFVYFDFIFIAFPFLFLLFGILYIYGKAVENSCMIIRIKSKEATVGDWLYEKVRIGKRTIKPYWEGLDEEEVKLLRKVHKKIKIKTGIPFVPAFLIGFLAFVFLKEKLIGF